MGWRKYRHHVEEWRRVLGFDDGRMRYQEPQPAPWTVQACDAEARTPIHPRPYEDESKHYSLPMREPDVYICAVPTCSSLSGFSI
jgi:hypothetical protein